LCRGTSEYNLLNVGNPSTGSDALKPEKSKQYTVGFRVEPTKSLSMGFDLWDVRIRDQIDTVPQDVIFNNGVEYRDSLKAYYDPIQKQTVLAALQRPFNLNSSHYQGIDWDHTFSTATPYGKGTVQWTGTYMLDASKSNS